MGKFIFKDKYISVYSKDSGEDSQKLAEDNGLFVLERLDKPVIGLLVFAGTKDAAAKMNRLIENRELDKTYYAVAEGRFESREGTMEDLLFHDKRNNKTFVVKRERAGVKKASLVYTVEDEKTEGDIIISRVRIKLQTGRTHQIRIQFASRKHPLAGDGKYGSHIKGRPALMAKELSFTHPYTGEKLNFNIDFPSESPWF